MKDNPVELQQRKSPLRRMLLAIAMYFMGYWLLSINGTGESLFWDIVVAAAGYLSILLAALQAILAGWQTIKETYIRRG